MIKNKLMVILAEKELTLNKLARQSGIRYATLWSFAKNRTHKADYEMLNRICKVLDCIPGDILKYIPDTEEQ
jgi:putative transcriptional regulator